jgi:hypothetical protein
LMCSLMVVDMRCFGLIQAVDIACEISIVVIVREVNSVENRSPFAIFCEAIRI